MKALSFKRGGATPGLYMSRRALSLYHPPIVNAIELKSDNFFILTNFKIGGEIISIILRTLKAIIVKVLFKNNDTERVLCKGSLNWPPCKDGNPSTL